MRRWVVTGPTGAGKSAVTALLAARGAAVLDGDRLGHEVLALPTVVAAIADRFGAGCVRDGAVDRAALGRHVFASPAELAALDSITHGPLCEAMETGLARLAAAGHALAVLEAAVYFRLPAPPRADLVIAVVADPGLRAGRLAARAGLTQAEALARVGALSHLDRDWSRADLTIHNNGGPADLAAAVDRLWTDHAP
ncbi:MAG: dephospho-CoA kinase [bacterium]|nr:dephospho-CoA kinase [bacterium]